MTQSFNVILLGLIQGLTEFLPVSSSGHLALAGHFFGLSEGSVTLAILLHFSTLFAVIVFFSKEILQVLSSFRRICLIAAATVPTGIIGLVLSKKVENIFEENVGLVYVLLFITGVLIFLSDRIRRKIITDDWGKMTYLKSFIVGVAQGIAVLPGISRSGATITAAIFSGIERKEAARFSFLMAIPAVAGATLLELRKFNLGEIVAMNPIAVISSMAVGFASGIFGLWFLLRIIKTPNFRYFAYYLWIVSIAGLLFSR